MYDLKTIKIVVETLRKIKTEACSISSLLNKASPESLKQAENLAEEIYKNLEFIGESLSTDSELKKKHFSKKLAQAKKVMNQNFANNLMHKGAFYKAEEIQDESRKKTLLNNVCNGLKYLDEELADKMLTTCYHIIGLIEFLDQGQAKSPLPKNEVTEEELYGPIKKILDDLRGIMSRWAKHNHFNGKLWISGSLVDGVSPVKGLFENGEFIIHKPFDYKKYSDIDIGIGLDRIAFGNEIPAHLQKNDRMPTGLFFSKQVISLCSDSFEKEKIKKEFKPAYGKKYIKLIESIEPLKLRGVTLKRRGVHVQFFVVDNHLPASGDLHILQRKFVVYNNFKQPSAESIETSAIGRVTGILDKELGKGRYEGWLVKHLLTLKSEHGSYREVKPLARELSNRSGFSKKKAEKILSEIFRI